MIKRYRRYKVWSMFCALSLLATIGLFGDKSAVANDDDWETADVGKTGINDRYEKVNRKVLELNRKLGNSLQKYHSGTFRCSPENCARMLRVKRRATNVLNNLSEPWYAVNGVLQGKFDAFFTSLGRFLVNSTIGVLGIFDVADSLGARYKPLDLVSTFKHYGAPPGPYVMLPILGPSSGRDATGLMGDFLLDVTDNVFLIYGLYPLIALRIGAFVALKYSDVDEASYAIQSLSVDEYSMLRSLYTQSTNAQ